MTLYVSEWLRMRVGLSRISSQVPPVSHLGEWRHICHFFRWQKMWRVTFVTLLGRMWRSRTRIFFFNLWRFLSHPSRKTSHFGPASTKLFWTGRNITIRLELTHTFLLTSQDLSLISEAWSGKATCLEVGLGISRSNADSQWNPVYNTFHRNFCCGNETICR